MVSPPSATRRPASRAPACTPSNSHWASSALASRKRRSLPAAVGTSKPNTARGNAMSEFTIRSESVDVEQIMKQIRTRILEKRGADYTEEQIRELASVRLEKFLDRKSTRLNSSHSQISYAVFCLKKKTTY